MNSAASLAYECPVCFEKKILKLLPCFHRYCAGCINKLECSEKEDGRAHPFCPVCCKLVVLPGEAAWNLPDVSDSWVTCQVPAQCMCEQEVTHVCVTCPTPEFLGGQCLKYHEKQQATRDHEIVTVAEWKVGHRTSMARRSRGVCKQHRGEKVKFYCEECKEPACSLCQPIKHQDHKLQVIGDKGKEAALHIEETTRTLYNIAHKYCTTVNDCHNIACAHEKQVESAERKVESAAAKARKMLKADCDKAINELLKKYEADMEDVEARKDEELAEIRKRKSKAHGKLEVLRRMYEAHVSLAWDKVRAAAAARQTANLVELIEFSESYAVEQEVLEKVTVPLALPSTPSLLVNREKAKEMQRASLQLRWKEKGPNKSQGGLFERKVAVPQHWTRQVKLVRDGVSNILPGPPQVRDLSQPGDEEGDVEYMYYKDITKLRQLIPDTDNDAISGAARDA